jgi:hypothetical protein
VFGDNEGKPYNFIAFVFFFLKYDELSLILIGKLECVPKLFALEKSCEPFREVAHFAH